MSIFTAERNVKTGYPAMPTKKKIAQALKGCLPEPKRKHLGATFPNKCVLDVAMEGAAETEIPLDFSMEKLGL
jgi:hypothetical protein